MTGRLPCRGDCPHPALCAGAGRCAQLAALEEGALADAGPAWHTPEAEAEYLAYVGQLVTLEQEGARTTLAIGPYSAFTIIGALQLLLRHPDLGDGVRQLVTGFKDQLATLFTGTPGEHLVRLGDDPANDVPDHRRAAGDGVAPRPAGPPGPPGPVNVPGWFDIYDFAQATAVVCPDCYTQSDDVDNVYAAARWAVDHYEKCPA